MSILGQLEHDLQRAAERRLSNNAPSRRRSWWRQRSRVLPAAIAAAVLVGAGGSALLFAPGRAVPPAFVLAANPNVGLGQPIKPSLALLPMRVADPTGGPPWGMRVIRTSRGLACIQAGRVQGASIGALGVGYAFKGDGRFHPFEAADAVSLDSCPTLAGDGSAFQPGAFNVVTKDGLPLAGENIYPYERVHCDLPDQEDWGVRCPQSDLREVAVGILGPEATSIRVTTPRRSFTVTPYGRFGAYLIVLSAPPHANSGPYGFQGRRAPGTPTLTVSYRDGSSCRLPATTTKQQCSPKGLRYSRPKPPSATHLKTPVRVTYSSLLNATGPLMMLGEHGQVTPPSEKPGPGLTIAFTAPAAAPTVSSGYDVQIEPHASPGCSTPSMIVAQPTSQTIAVGQRVQITVPLESSCRATYTGRVFFVGSTGTYGEARTSNSSEAGPLYEVIARGLSGPGSHAHTFGATVARFQISVP